MKRIHCEDAAARRRQFVWRVSLTNRVKPLQTKGGSDVSKSRDALRYRGFIGWK
jgi:hypothetical protein